MSDIVEWLRDRAFRKSGPTMEAAHTKQQEWVWADEIERLREKNENLRADLEDTKSLLANKPISFLRPTENYDWWCVSIMERRKRVAAEKENEKLRTEVMSDYNEGWEEGLSAMKAKNEKLRAALSALAEHCNNMEAQNQDYYTMGEGGAPCLSQPLAAAYNIIKDGM